MSPLLKEVDATQHQLSNYCETIVKTITIKFDVTTREHEPARRCQG